MRAPAPLQQRARQSRIESAERADVVDVIGAFGGSGVASAREAQQQPRRDRDRDDEGKEHRDRGVGRNRAHVGAHHAAHEHHRQQRRDDRQRRDDGRIADFGDGLDRGLDEAAPVAHRPMPGDVLDDDDRVVDENADREDQREQADPIDRVAHQPRREQRQQDRGGNDDEHHHAFAPADGEGDENDDRQGRQAEVEQQLVGLFGRGRAVVARHRDVDPRRHDPPFDDLQTAQHVVGDRDRVGALALGDGDGERRPALQLRRWRAASSSRRDVRARRRRRRRWRRP